MARKENSDKHNSCERFLKRSKQAMIRTWRNRKALRKLVHAINRYFLTLKTENFQLKNFDIFLIFAQNIDCGYTLEPPRRGGSNEYPQSMFWSKNKKNRYTPAYPSFAIQKWGLRGYTLHGHVFLMQGTNQIVSDNYFFNLDCCVKF